MCPPAACSSRPPSRPISRITTSRGELTYSGHPLAMAAIVATLDAMTEEQMVEQAARTGRELLGPGLRQLGAEARGDRQVRGLGLFWALELVSDRARRTPLPADRMGQIKRTLIERNLLPFVVDNHILWSRPASSAPPRWRRVSPSWIRSSPCMPDHEAPHGGAFLFFLSSAAGSILVS